MFPVKRSRTESQRGPEPVEVVGVSEAGAADGAVGQSVLGVDEKMSSQRAGGAEGPPTHRAHIALAAAHHGRVLRDAAEREKGVCQRTTAKPGRDYGI